MQAETKRNASREKWVNVSKLSASKLVESGEK